jgi:hypothetical protein
MSPQYPLGGPHLVWMLWRRIPCPAACVYVCTCEVLVSDMPAPLANWTLTFLSSCSSPESERASTVTVVRIPRVREKSVTRKVDGIVRGSVTGVMGRHLGM